MTNKQRNLLERAAGWTLRTMGYLANFVSDQKKRRLCVVMDGAVLYPSSSILNGRSRESIVIGPRSRVLASLHTMGHGGRIEIGCNCFIGEDTRIWSASSIAIGDRVLISHGVNIHDTNSHSASASRRAQHFNDIFSKGHPTTLPDVPTRPIVICNDAWIGFNATVLKGVTIGEGSIVGACSLVTKDVPPFTVVAGSPARVVGHSTR